MEEDSQPSDLALQLFLAKELPELLYPHTGMGDTNVFWNDTRTPVTPREWDWIVREVEKKLNRDEQRVYWDALCKEALPIDSTQISLAVFVVAVAPWQTRAVALAKTLENEITE